MWAQGDQTFTFFRQCQKSRFALEIFSLFKSHQQFKCFFRHQAGQRRQFNGISKLYIHTVEDVEKKQTKNYGCISILIKFLKM